MAEINWFADTNHIQHLSGSGIGFYGPSFSQPVPVGEYQDKTYITNGVGTSLGPESNNIKYLNPASGVLNGASSGLPLTAIPNFQSTFEMRFSHPTPVKTTNARLYIYDRTNLNNPPSGLTVKLAELVHPSLTQTNDGSGSPIWESPAGSSYLALTASPGVSGFRPNGVNTVAADHSWFIAASFSPDSVGSKTLFGMVGSVEYY